MTNETNGEAPFARVAPNENPAAHDWAAARGDQWRAHVSRMEAMLTPLDEPLIRRLSLDAPQRVADVGCGGGGTALAILRSSPRGTSVHAFDISPSLIELARARARPADPSLVFEVADVATSIPAKPYDRLVSRFGVMFFDDPPAAFANLVRWLAPGGRFAFAVWGRPSENPWMSSVREAVAGVVEMAPVDPDAPGAFRYADTGTLLALLDRVGFGDLEVSEWKGPLRIGGGLPPIEAAHFAFAAFSSFREILANAGDEAFDDAHHALTERFSRHREDGVVQLDARVHIVTGTRLP